MSIDDDLREWYRQVLGEAYAAPDEDVSDLWRMVSDFENESDPDRQMILDTIDRLVTLRAEVERMSEVIDRQFIANVHLTAENERLQHAHAHASDCAVLLKESTEREAALRAENADLTAEMEHMASVSKKRCAYDEKLLGIIRDRDATIEDLRNRAPSYGTATGDRLLNACRKQNRELRAALAEHSGIKVFGRDDIMWLHEDGSRLTGAEMQAVVDRAAALLRDKDDE